jgi:ADP-ribose pyrophosphatase
VRWRKLNEEVVYESFRRILSRRFELPDGNTAELEVIDLADSVVVLPLTVEDDVVLARQFRPGPEEVLLELPGGVVDPGHTPAEAARAELLEETGYVGDLVEVGSLRPNAYATKTKYVFAATGCRRVGEPAADEQVEVVLLSLPEFREHLRTGLLTDTDGAYRALDHLNLL